MLYQVCKFTMSLFQIFGQYDVRSWILFLLLPVLILSFIKRLSIISDLSAVANVLCFVGLVGTYQFLFFNIGNPGDYPAFGPLKELPLFFGTALFAFEGIGIVSYQPLSFISAVNILIRFIII